MSSEQLVHPGPDSWLTYNGTYSGQRFSPLTQINPASIDRLGLNWTFRAETGTSNAPPIKSTPLEADGILYFTLPDHAWAIDARSGRSIWHFAWQSKGGIHIGNRGVALYKNNVYFETPDDHLICLDKNTGHMLWNVVIADLDLEYFATPAPVVINNHIIVGIGGDSLDVPGYLEARDPDNGQVQWHFNTTPRKGEPGIETWPNEESALHGGGTTWMSGTYDPDLHLYFFGTGNPNPVFASQSRAGDNLYTGSIIALNPDTGKMAWYFQTTPHDTHDWDDVETPILFEAKVEGKPRRLLVQAARNGYLFVLDRVTGKVLLSKPYVNTNWSLGTDAGGRPIPNPEKFPAVPGVLVAPGASAANWPAASFSPLTGLFYVNAYEGFQEWYLIDTSKAPQGYGGSSSPLWSHAVLKAIDPLTGTVRWQHPYAMSRREGMTGLLTTAGGLLFAGDATNNIVAYRAADGSILWHAGLGELASNGPITYELDGQQYFAVAAGDVLYAFRLNH